MGDNLLRKEKVLKNYSASNVLKAMGWPKPMHQKIVNMRYNQEYRKISEKADEPLPKAAILYFPTANPIDIKHLELQLKMQGTLAKAHNEIRKNYERISKDVMKLWPEYAAAFKKHKEFQKLAEKYSKRCAEALAACGAQAEHMKFVNNTLPALEKKLKQLKKDWDEKTGGVSINGELLSYKDSEKLIKKRFEEGLRKQFEKEQKQIMRVSDLHSKLAEIKSVVPR